MYKYFPYKRMDHKEILLYGFHFSFFLVFFLAVLRDVYFANYFNATVNLSAWFATVLSYYLLHYKSKKHLASYIVMAIAVIPLYILIYFNHFGNLVIVYVILLPIAAYFLLEFTQALIVNGLIYILLVGMLYYIGLINPEAPILNNPLALINIVFASILVMFFGVFYHLAIDSSLSALIHSNRQKDILLKEVHHRVKNNLNVTASLLGLQANGKTQETKEELLRSKERIEAIAIVHEMLYKQDDFSQIVFNEYVQKLNILILKSLSLQDSVTLHIEQNNQLSLPLESMLQLGLIINEMITNSLKHARSNSPLTISISLQKQDGNYHFVYKDNGVKEIDVSSLHRASGLGMRLIDLSVRQLDGKVKVEYKGGLVYEVIF